MSLRDEILSADRRLLAEDYHAHPALSFSQLYAIGTEDCPTPSRKRRTRDDDSDALRMGTLAHIAWLEPHNLDSVAVRPTKPDGTLVRSNSREYGEWLLANSGKIIVTPDMMETMRGIMGTLREVPIVSKYRSACDLVCAEASLFWTDEETGIECRIRPDALLIASDGTLINEDLKTCQDPSPREFRSDAIYRGYVRRMAWYREGLRVIFGVDSEQVMLAVGKKYRSAAVYRINEYDLDAAEQQNREALRRYAAGDEWAHWEMEITDL